MKSLTLSALMFFSMLGMTVNLFSQEQAPEGTKAATTEGSNPIVIVHGAWGRQTLPMIRQLQSLILGCLSARERIVCRAVLETCWGTFGLLTR